MPKNKGKGGKNRRRGKNENEDFKRELILREPGQCYGQVVRMLGSSNVEAMCFDNVKRICHIRGKMRKKVWVNMSDIILVGLREFQDEKADVILKYTADEARLLKSRGEIPDYVNVTDMQFGQDQGGDDIYFEERMSNDESGDEAQEVESRNHRPNDDFGTGNLNRNHNTSIDYPGISEDEEEDSDRD
jgi:translation initiation factor 1A